MFAYWERQGRVEVAFTDRHGGVSAGPYASLDLARRAAGEPREHDGRVEQNLAFVASALARQGQDGDGSSGPADQQAPVLVPLDQVHGSDVFVVDADYVAGRTPRPPVVADASVTDLPGVALMVRVADCVPVLLADPTQQVVAAVHAGRKGLVAGVVPAAVSAMRGQGARTVRAWVGPHVCGACYELPESLRDEVCATVPQAYAQTSWGTPSVDLGAGVRAQLEAAGAEVVDAARCTVEDDDLFSYRRQGEQAGRMAGLVWVRP